MVGRYVQVQEGLTDRYIIHTIQSYTGCNHDNVAVVPIDCLWAFRGPNSAVPLVPAINACYAKGLQPAAMIEAHS